MPRTRRYIKSNSLYEITFRARQALPFVCAEYMNLILQGILARVQRDNKVILHDYLFQGSHPHIICTAKDANQCQKFYGQLQKQITDSIKRLLGQNHLNIWEGRASVIEIPTLEDAIAKIGYQWLRLFLKEANAEELADVRKRILDNLRQREKENAERRKKTGKQVLGQARLRRQPLLSTHDPKKKNRKIFVQSMFKKIRQRIIDEMKYVDDLCRKAYQRWKRGDFSVIWPPGTFPPPLPPMANAVSC